MKFDNHITNEYTPRMGNAISRAIGSGIMRLIGWEIVGELPKLKKVILVGEPHTSNWDFILAMAAIQSVGLRVSYMMKKEAFFWPLGGFFKWMGGIPIERSTGKDSLAQIREWMDTHDNVWLGLTPNGTRKPTEKYKTGYLRIAKAVDAPMFLVGIDGPNKKVMLDRLVWAEGDVAKQNKNIKDYMDATYRGINPENQRPGELPTVAPKLIGDRGQS